MLWTFILELIALGALVKQALGAPQDQGPTSSAPSCGGCNLVADVAAIVWYSEIFVQTDTKLVAISIGNVTRTTMTSIIQNRGQVTFNPTATTAGGNSIALTSVDYSPTINFGGVNLTSPTPYNIFTAFTFTTTSMSEGVCVTKTSSSSLASAFSETLSSASGQITLDRNGEQSFITARLGLTDCVGGGESVAAVAHVQVTVTTTTSTFTGTLPTAAAAHTTSSVPSTTSFSSSTSSYSSSASSSSVFLGSPNSFTPPILSTITSTSVIATKSITISSSSSPDATSAFTSSHATISLAPLPMVVINNQTLTPLSSPKTVAVGNITATANSEGAYVFPGSQTLAPGGSLTLSAGPSANATIVAFTGDAGDKRGGFSFPLWISISACLVASGMIT